jgi:hypothetical protein
MRILVLHHIQIRIRYMVILIQVTLLQPHGLLNKEYNNHHVTDPNSINYGSNIACSMDE